MGQSLGAKRTTRWDFLKKAEWGFPVSTTGPTAPRPPTHGLQLPPGCHIPDYKQYRVNDIPQLLDVQKKLAARGLKDPWLRNEVWRYDPKNWGTKTWRIWGLVAPGLLYGFGLFLVVVVCEETILKDKDDHKSHH
ncbi:NADH dehydrogenase [ubiquinone] 1 beta subcomplex subunit 3-like [Oppia nitens]|uniref:NADH dehydrogenase [ubiquinone] 1 beta subcomplex subunit 3-like n=1 Tax=Oppia nitens TaxID=1686743 RepID=UPI0023DA0280|nr:NADH dehydrogenase [ubiquinone] 1 beta subcomplex subunit 3-like [Oppia nitens]